MRSSESSPSAVIFDMDGVLADTEPLHAETYVRVFREMGLELTVEEYLDMVTRGQMDVRDVYQSIGGDMAYWKEVMDTKSVMVKAMLAERDVLLPGVVDLLQSLKTAGIPTAVATAAGKRSLGMMLDRFDLRRYFDEFVTWEDVQASKPDPEAFIIAAQKLGVTSEDCVVIEDSPRGVLAAHRARMKCIAVPNNSTSEGDFSTADLIVNSLEEVNLETLKGLFVKRDA